VRTMVHVAAAMTQGGSDGADPDTRTYLLRTPWMGA
jgi:hypothetical protein